jgi:hypothetical protein
MKEFVQSDEDFSCPLRFNQVLIFRTPSQMAIGGQEYGCFSSNFGGVQPKVCVRDGEETGKNHIL